jgi:hypothetical protein
LVTPERLASSRCDSFVTGPDEAESPTDIDAHRKSLLQVFRIEQICPDVTSKINVVAGARKDLLWLPERGPVVP